MRGSGRVNRTGCTTAQDVNASTLHAVDRSRQIFPADERRLAPLILNVSLSPSRSDSRQFGVDPEAAVSVLISNGELRTFAPVSPRRGSRRDRLDATDSAA